MNKVAPPPQQGLYDPRFEHDACGIGAVANIDGKREFRIIELAKQVLVNLSHRGAAGADEVSGDGAGILLQIPHDLFVQECEKLGFSLAEIEPESYGVGQYFAPNDAGIRASCEGIFAQAVEDCGLRVLGWREVPRDNSCIAGTALAAEPQVKQVFVDGCGLRGAELERKLYQVRKRCQNFVVEKFGERAEEFYICSLSCRTICYKGMLMADQLFKYYDDLSNPKACTAIAVVHQRYSTNTFPSWKLAQPFRCIAHNGEINTLRGNVNQFRSCEPKMSSELLGDAMEDIIPVIEPGLSDSATFDNVLELLSMAGRSMPHAMMAMIPEAFGESYHISTDKRAFYEYHASFLSPWDGPAAVVFTDGNLVGGTLDRNGLRPARYTITHDGVVVIASETGVIDFAPSEIRQKGRLQPGKMFLVDTQQGRIVTDNEVKSKIVRQRPYRRWLKDNRMELRGLFDAAHPLPKDSEEIQRDQRLFGYTREELQRILVPMAVNSQEPVGSMGDDAAPAVLSEQPLNLFSYFKQMFAQVTNPPIDPLREGLVMSLMAYTGRDSNLLDETPEHCRQLKLPHPILTNEDLLRLRTVEMKGFKIVTLDSLFDVNATLEEGLQSLTAQAKEAAREGASLLVLSDRKHSEKHLPIPALLAGSAVHQALLEEGLRGGTGLIIESGEPRDVMHFCLLCGYGINAINPYLAFESLTELQKTGDIAPDIDPTRLVDGYIAAVKKGMLKVMSKMGISCLRSYHDSGLFEAIGLAPEFVAKYFPGTSSRIGGIGIEEITAESHKRHKKAYEKVPAAQLPLEYGGEYHYRKNERKHNWTPEGVANLQQAVRQDDPAAYKKFAGEMNNQNRQFGTLRGLLTFSKSSNPPIGIDEVEPASEIVKRFCTGAMSHGSISSEAHEAMAIAMNRLGAMSNTGEGGEDTARYTPEANGDSKNCAIKQVASGRFGVTLNYLSRAKEIQIKMAQGAKPGEGGHLPGEKVTEAIAKLRYSTPGVSLISPPPHHDIYSIEDLAQLIYDLKCSNPGVKVSVKLVAEVGVGTIAAGVAKGNADEVLISGGDGGSGATPFSSIKYAGIPWELGLAETQQTLVLNGLRDRIRVQTDGQLRTGRDVVIAAMLGAEQFGFGTSALVALGCLLMRKCHLGTCPAGIATQKECLRKRFIGKPEHVERYMLFIAEEVREIMAELGIGRFEELVGRVEGLEMQEAIEFWKAKGLDFSKMLTKPTVTDPEKLRLTSEQEDKHADHIDWGVISEIEEKQKDGDEKTPEKITLQRDVHNTDRTVGAILSNHLIKKYGEEGLADDTVTLQMKGSAGQSFGAFLTKGVTLHLVGDTNDYLGKGLSGGRVIVQKPPEASYYAAENIAVGNTLLYGATSGEVFVNGVAGERFAVRNSGVTAVVEGVGDHGCEYMTGGTVVVLGQAGRNFAAGMSGGIAYVLDQHQLFDTLCNLDMVDLETVWQPDDVKRLTDLIQRHWEYTKSRRAREILDAMPEMAAQFVKVMPIEYKKALRRMAQQHARSEASAPATEEVYNG